MGFTSSTYHIRKAIHQNVQPEKSFHIVINELTRQNIEIVVPNYGLVQMTMFSRQSLLGEVCYYFATKSNYLERASATDFKDAAAARFGNGDVMKSIYFDLVIAKKLKYFKKSDKKVIKFKKRVSCK